MRKYTEKSDGSYTYVASEGEAIDEIAFDFYRTQVGSAEHVYDNNRDISQLTIELPAGTIVKLPPMPVKKGRTNRIKLWDRRAALAAQQEEQEDTETLTDSAAASAALAKVYAEIAEAARDAAVAASQGVIDAQVAAEAAQTAAEAALSAADLAKDNAEAAASAAAASAAASEASKIAAQAAATQAANSASSAQTYAEALGGLVGRYDTYAEANAAAASLNDDDFVEVTFDENDYLPYNGRSVYRVTSGALGATPEYKLPKWNSDPGTTTDLIGRGMINPAGQGNHADKLALDRRLTKIRDGTEQYFRIVAIGDSLATVNWSTFHTRVEEYIKGWFPDEVQEQGSITGTKHASGFSSYTRDDYSIHPIGNWSKLAPGGYVTMSAGNGVPACDGAGFSGIIRPGNGKVRLMIAEVPNANIDVDHPAFRDPLQSEITSAHTLTTRTETITNAVDNGSGLIRLTIGDTSNWMNNEWKTIAGVTGTTEANGDFRITIIDSVTVDLQGSTFTNAYVSGGTISSDELHVDLDGTGPAVENVYLQFDTYENRMNKIMNVGTVDADFYGFGPRQVDPALTGPMIKSGGWASGSNAFRNTDPACQFWIVNALVQGKLNGSPIDMFVIESDDDLEGYQIILPLLRDSIDEAVAEGVGVQKPYVCVVGNPGIDINNGVWPTGPGGLIARNQWCAEFCAQNGWDYVDLMSHALGYENMAHHGVGADGVHMPAYYEYGTRWWAHERGVLRPVQERDGGWTAGFDDLRPGLGADRYLTTDNWGEIAMIRAPFDTGYCDWLFTPEGDGSAAKVGDQFQFATGTTADSTIRGAINAGSPMIGLLPSNGDMKRAPGTQIMFYIRITSMPVDGAIYLFGAQKGDHDDPFAGEGNSHGFGFRITRGATASDAIITGIYRDGSTWEEIPTTGDYVVNNTNFALVVALRLKVISGTNVNFRGCEFWMDNTLLGSTNRVTSTSAWKLPCIEAANGASGGNLIFHCLPPKWLY